MPASPMQYSSIYRIWLKSYFSFYSAIIRKVKKYKWALPPFFPFLLYIHLFWFYYSAWTKVHYKNIQQYFVYYLIPPWYLLPRLKKRSVSKPCKYEQDLFYIEFVENLRKKWKGMYYLLACVMCCVFALIFKSFFLFETLVNVWKKKNKFLDYPFKPLIW